MGGSGRNESRVTPKTSANEANCRYNLVLGSLSLSLGAEFQTPLNTAGDTMARPCFALAFSLLVAVAPSDAVEPKPPVRGVFARPERLTPEFLGDWKAKGATAVVVPLDEETKGRWQGISDRVERVGMSLWLWVEVARNSALADAHPEWMAATGGHHDDWRRRFANSARAKDGQVIKAWPWVPIGYAPAFAAHRERLKTLLADLPGAWAGVFLERPPGRSLFVRLRKRPVPLGPRLRHARDGGSNARRRRGGKVDCRGRRSPPR